MADNAQNELNEQIEDVIEDAEVMTVPIDTTLSISGEAADAKAVGDALAEKADRSEIQTRVRVNGQEADEQGLILVDAGHVPMEDGSETTVREAIQAVDDKTAGDIPMSGETGAGTIADAIEAEAARTAQTIRMGAGAGTIAAAIQSLSDSLQTLGQTVAGLDSKTAADIPMSGETGAETIAERIAGMEEGLVRTVNGIGPDEDGNVPITKVDYADNLTSDEMSQVDDEFLRRTSGGSGSLQDGEAWAIRIQGNRIHDGYTAESLRMSVIPMPRPTPAAITASIDEATFEAYVSEAGTYILEYDGTDWSLSPALYGVTVTGEPIDGDEITITWDGVNNAVLSVSAVPRTAPDPITATIDRDVFVAYVDQSGTTLLTYTTEWSADPALYGVTVSGEPIAGDQIRIVYVKEIRGTIRQATPERLVGTGWNLYEIAMERAYVVRYSDTYGYRIGGTYTSVQWAASISGERTTITPVGGLFNVPGDGVLFIAGGDATTYVYSTWSDWTEGYAGDFETYQESAVDLSAIMTSAFPYGLCRVGDVRDEIDVNTAQAYRRIDRMAYTENNLANAIASGRGYEYDEDYIYVVRENPVVSAVSISAEYTICEHGLEFFDGSSVPVYAEILYGQNLKDKLRRQVVAVSPQSFTDGEKAQARENIGAAAAADLTSLRAGLTYVEDGDTIAANASYTEGKFIAWKGEIYRILTTINTTVTSENWTTYLTKQDGIGGALSQINGDLASLNSKITPQNLNMTLLSGWSLKSWGQATAIKTGNIVVVSLSGLISNTDVSVDTAFAQIDGLSPTGFVMATGKTNYQSGHIILSAHAGETNIYINSAHANENNYGQLIIPVNN